MTHLDERSETRELPLTSIGRRSTGAAALALVLLGLLCTAALAAVFEFPGILDQPAEYVLPRFAQHQSFVVIFYAIFAVTGLLLIPVATGMRRVLEAVVSRRRATTLGLITSVGVVAGVLQAVGFLRWAYAVPHLAQTYLDPAAGPTMKDAVSVAYATINGLLGHEIGEQLGFFFNAAWGLGVGIMMLRSRAYTRRFALIGAISAVGFDICEIGAQLPDPFGGISDSLFALGYTIWLLWLAVLGVKLVRAPSAAAA